MGSQAGESRPQDTNGCFGGRFHFRMSKPSYLRRSDRPVNRIRGRKLQSIRSAHFRDNPLCVHCETRGIVRIATELDHIEAIINGGHDVPSNRQGLCRDCHEAKTAIDLGHKPKRKVGVDGYPA